LFSAGERFTGADSHLEVTRSAKFPACHGNGEAKAKHKGKGKGKVAQGHATPLSFCGKHPVMNEQ
jgi:hypothetical protein